MLYSTFSSSFNLQESLATIGEKVCAEVNSCLSQHGFAPFSAERETGLKGQIQAAANPDNTICKLIGTLWRKRSVLKWPLACLCKTVGGMSWRGFSFSVSTTCLLWWGFLYFTWDYAISHWLSLLKTNQTPWSNFSRFSNWKVSGELSCI